MGIPRHTVGGMRNRNVMRCGNPDMVSSVCYLLCHMTRAIEGVVVGRLNIWHGNSACFGDAIFWPWKQTCIRTLACTHTDGEFGRKVGKDREKP